ncbi:uncharacterized protein [Argopecten irradians]|uniref:uncharacterized protein n=1 Tax=Argopecten irradians TaxID=31199 RepID=UPI003715FD35
MDVLFIFLLCVPFGITVGYEESSEPGSNMSPDDVNIRLLTLISDLESRVKSLEESRTEETGRMRDMQSEIDELKSENNRLWQLCGRAGADAKTKSENDSSSFDHLLDGDELGSSANVIEKKNVETRETELDVPMKTRRSLFRRHSWKVPSSAERFSKRVPIAEPSAFHANLGQNMNSVSVNQELIFDNVVTNNDHGYSPHTGTFTCKQAGTYVFSWTVMTSQNNYLESHLMKNGGVVAYVFTANGFSWGSSTGLSVIHLDIGDDVWVKVTDHTDGVIVHNWSMFSGFRLN